MPRRESPLQSEMVQGTLDMLILRTLVLGPAHGQTIATFEFVTGVDEIFDVCLLEGVRGAALRGPHAHDDGHGEIWVVPQPDHAAPSPES